MLHLQHKTLSFSIILFKRAFGNEATKKVPQLNLFFKYLCVFFFSNFFENKLMLFNLRNSTIFWDIQKWNRGQPFHFFPKVKDYSGGLKIGNVFEMKKLIAVVLKSVGFKLP